MSKIHNSIYGLALGDATGFRTEFLRYEQALESYGKEDLAKVEKKLLISDDTQMSLYLVQAFQKSYDPKMDFKIQEPKVVYEIARQFIIWHDDIENFRAPGSACMASLRRLKQILTVAPMSWSNILEASKVDKDSKGSGTVMRSPWLGLLNAIDVIPDEHLSDISKYQSCITHRHPTAIGGAYLTSLLTSKLYKGELHPGELADFSRDFCKSRNETNLWDEVLESLDLIYALDASKGGFKGDYDTSYYIGRRGTADDVLVSAIAIIDNFGTDPLEVIRRSMLTGGDSDTIGAVAGGMIGAYYNEPIWSSVEHVLEELYIPQLDNAVSYLESLVK